MLLRFLLLASFLPASALADAGGDSRAPDHAPEAPQLGPGDETQAVASLRRPSNIPAASPDARERPTNVAQDSFACAQEPALSVAAGELLLRAELPSTDALARAVRDAGSDAVGVRALFWNDRAPPGRARAWLAAFAAKADAPAACGLAHGENKHLLLVVARAGTLGPLVPRTRLVKGNLRDGFTDAQLVIEDARGTLQRVGLDAHTLSHGVPISPDLPRPARIQLLARGPNGPRPVAERVLPSETPAEDPTAADAESPPAADHPGARGASDGTRIATLLERLRRAHRAPPLRDNALLSRVADEHARHVCALGIAAHELDHAGDPAERLRQAGLEARRVGETVARATSTDAAFSAFERSPSHLLTLLERGFTDVGIGAHSDAEGHRCVVIMLAEWPRYVGR